MRAGSSAPGRDLAAVTPAEQAKFGLSWSLKLTSEGGFIVALIAGLVIANVFPRFAERLRSRGPARALYQDRHRHSRRLHRGHRGGQAQPRLVAAAARRRGDRRGVSHLLAGRLSDRPQGLRLQPRMVGAARLRHFDLRGRGGDRDRRRDPGAAAGAGARLVAGGDLRGRSRCCSCRCIAQTFMAHEPLVAAAWMGLAVKTDGAAVAAGGITQSLIQAKAAAEGINYQPGWMLSVTATVKVFIDVFIGVWAFILAWIWTNHINPGGTREGAGRSRSGGASRSSSSASSRPSPSRCALALRDARRRLRQARRGDRRSQRAAGDLLHPDLLLDRRDVELPQALGRMASASSPQSMSSRCSASSSGSGLSSPGSFSPASSRRSFRED